MANICTNTLYFNFDDKAKAAAFADIIREAEKKQAENDTPGCYYPWLGYIPIVCGAPYHKNERGYTVLGDATHPAPDYGCRGEIVYLDCVGDTVIVDVDTAWEPAFGAFAVALEHIGLPFKDGAFEGVDVSYYSSEPGFELYAASDTDTAEGDCHVDFMMEHEPGDDGEYRSSYDCDKQELLEKIAKAAGTTPDDKNLIEKYELALSDGRVRISLRVPSMEFVKKLFLPDIPKLQYTVHINGVVTGDCYGSYDECFAPFKKKYPEIETLREGITKIMAEYRKLGYDFNIYADYGVSLNITDFTICDWLFWTRRMDVGFRKRGCITF